jgi:hypothetical protein
MEHHMNVPDIPKWAFKELKTADFAHTEELLKRCDSTHRDLPTKGGTAHSMFHASSEWRRARIHRI